MPLVHQGTDRQALASCQTSPADMHTLPSLSPWALLAIPSLQDTGKQEYTAIEERTEEPSHALR